MNAYLLQAAPEERKDLLRHLLLDIPARLTKRQATVSGLARSLDISRITASAFFNMTQAQFPISLKMAVKLYLATRGYLPAIKEDVQCAADADAPLWIYPTAPEDWLYLDEQYRDPSKETQIDELITALESKIRPLVAYTAEVGLATKQSQNPL